MAGVYDAFGLSTVLTVSLGPPGTSLPTLPDLGYRVAPPDSVVLGGFHPFLRSSGAPHPVDQPLWPSYNRFSTA